MNNNLNLQFHYKSPKGWMNDPNGLIYYKDYYHIFYQMCPNEDKPWIEPMHWGHARTKDFLTWEDLPIALHPDMPYDKDGCWSGTAIVKEDTLFLFYASVIFDEESGKYLKQTISIATSTDGINFEKYSGNPVINQFPADGCFDFRDPAVYKNGDSYKLLVATGHESSKQARLLQYESKDLLNWEYIGIMSAWDNSLFAECPSLVKTNDCVFLGTSVVKLDDTRSFDIMCGFYNNEQFCPKVISNPLIGPDQYAGQLFLDALGRCILLAWIPGWDYANSDLRLGCLSVPLEVTCTDKSIRLFPIEEFGHLLSDTDARIELLDSGLILHRDNQDDILYKGKIKDIAILKDNYVYEIFINKGEQIITAVII